jgi:16S rRNA (guanine527-N7)-methyltransferase
MEKAAGFGVTLDSAAAGTMLDYLDRLLEANQSINLTSVRDPDKGVARHLLDSLAIGLHLREAPPPRRVIDLGTGGGFPGVPIAVAWPRAEVHLVDATRKKVDAVRAIVQGLAIDNVRCHWARAGQRDALSDEAPPRAGLVAARAVGPLDSLLRDSHAWLEPGGCLVAWKSEVSAVEREAAARTASALRMESLPDLEYELGARRRLVRFRHGP